MPPKQQSQYPLASPTNAVERAIRRAAYPFRFLQRYSRSHQLTHAIQTLRDRLALSILRDVRITNDDVFIRVRDGREFFWEIGSNNALLSLPFFGDFEEKESLFVSKFVQPGWVVADIGANFGWYTTLLAGLVGSEGQVHCFEPVPAAADILQRNIALNPGADVVRLNRLALGEAAGIAEMCVPTREGSGTAWASLKKQDWGPHRKIECQIKSLADYADECGLKRLDFLKCDVEGAELLVMRGAVRLFERGIRPTLLFEYAPSLANSFAYSGQQIEELLTKWGYRFHTIDSSGRMVRVASLSDTPLEASFVASVPNRTESIE